jgi:hypothetical protein
MQNEKQQEITYYFFRLSTDMTTLFTPPVDSLELHYARLNRATKKPPLGAVAFQLVEVAGQVILGFPHGLDYLFISLRCRALLLVIKGAKPLQ